MLFEPSSEKLLAMIRNAEAKCDCGVDQFRLRQDAMENHRMEKFIQAQVKSRHYFSIQHTSHQETK